MTILGSGRSIKAEDFMALSAFSMKIDLVMGNSPVPNGDGLSQAFEAVHKWGHRDLPEYLPWMGPRYQFLGYGFPTSVFRGEGMALFLLATVLQPEVIAECYAGTGYALAWLAAGCPTAAVYGVDNYVEQNVHTEGYVRAQQLMKSLELVNVTLLHGSINDLCTSLADRKVNLYLSDGPYGEAPPLNPDVVVVRHDDTNGQMPERSFFFRGSSNMSVMCPTIEERDVLMGIMAHAFPVSRCNG